MSLLILDDVSLALGGKSIFEGKFHAQTYAQKAWKPNHSPAQPGCAPGMPNLGYSWVVAGNLG